MTARLEAGGGIASETGLRTRNEDFAQFVAPQTPAQRRRGILAIVADGIGGAPGGREAAEAAVGAFIEAFYAAPKDATLRDAAREAMDAANGTVIAAAKGDERLLGMGTTLSALALRDAEAAIVHVGDSRIYRLRGGDLVRLTEDHNLHRQGFPNILTRSLGAREDANPDCLDEAIQPGDRFLLCTDGLTTALSDSELSHILEAGHDPAKTAQWLAAAALGAGASDNVTALVADVTECPA